MDFGGIVSTETVGSASSFELRADSSISFTLNEQLSYHILVLASMLATGMLETFVEQAGRVSLC